MAEEVVKRKRGRPRKNKLPEEIQTLVSEVEEKIEQPKEIDTQVVEIPKSVNSSEWDIPIGSDIKYFDANLSYELTGYRPISETKGLDFNPNWFTETRDTFKRTGRYTEYRYGSKAFTDFWTE